MNDRSLSHRPNSPIDAGLIAGSEKSVLWLNFTDIRVEALREPQYIQKILPPELPFVGHFRKLI
ncbi:hypothetical protein [Leptolyngbya sp. NIES-2104]|uniref:hypothetical protein n=1 Tax=Leptolyngbya sp. NIES-2104 TaxID=1552121 RepID=UPI0006EC7675|nr:hypothetical protein [Leptolyngbya sp. NIES-2104]GAP95020.1 hypothetical protein NIES2104_15400 [Leptolyngbya sp. NIES-2104]